MSEMNAHFHDVMQSHDRLEKNGKCPALRTDAHCNFDIFIDHA